MNENYTQDQFFFRHHLRLTQARARLWKTISGFPGPFTAEDLLHAFGNKQSVHRATVFRDLEAFVRSGMLTELAVRGMKCRLFEITKKADSAHFVCQDCGIVTAIDLDLDNVMKKETAKLRKTGYETEKIGIKFYGRCKKCNRPKGGNS